MKKMTLCIAIAALTLSSPALFAAEHGGHDHGQPVMDHGGHSMMEKGNVVHQEVVDGVRATFAVTDMRGQMKGMELPRGMKETHHIAVEFREVKSGRSLTEGTAKVKVQGPDRKQQIKELMGMQGHFGADFDMSRKGKYGIMCKFLLRDGKTRQAQFWYSVK